MLLGEPPVSPYDLRFRIGNIPVRVHPFFWLVTLIMGSQTGDAVNLFLWLIACFVSILIHELGHAVAMRMYGEYPRIVLYGMGGLAISDGGVARGSWGGRRGGRRSAWEQIVISAAGPCAGFVFAALIVAIVIALRGQITVNRFLSWKVFVPNPRMLILVYDLLFINIYWGCVNLLPIFPLDGGQMARALFCIRDQHGGVRRSLWLSVIAAGGMSLIGFGVWHDGYVGFLFGWLAVSSYLALRSPW